MKFIHLTDPHLTILGQNIYGLDPYERLSAAIENINEDHSDADLCVITGDLAHSGEAKAYDALAKCIDKLNIPCHVIMGNHDHRERLQSSIDNIYRDHNGFIQSVLSTEEGSFFLLDTKQEGTHQGAYCENRLEWLSHQLTQNREKPAYLFMHHPPFDIGIHVMDQIGMKSEDARAVKDLLEDFDNVKHIFFGHVHRPIHGSWNGISFSTLRGTNHQVRLDFSDRDIIPGSHEQPAYAVVFLQPEMIIVHNHDYLDSSPKFDLGSWRWDEWNTVNPAQVLSDS